MYILSYTDSSGVTHSQSFIDHMEAITKQRCLRKEHIIPCVVWDEGTLIIVGKMGADGVVDGRLPNGEMYNRNIRRKK